MLEWKTTGAFEVEEQLSKIKNWIESVKSNIEPLIITKNKLFRIRCQPVQVILLPLLDQVFNEICEIILGEINKDLASFIKLISNINQVSLFIFVWECLNVVWLFSWRNDLMKSLLLSEMVQLVGKVWIDWYPKEFYQN